MKNIVNFAVDVSEDGAVKFAAVRRARPVTELLRVLTGI